MDFSGLVKAVQDFWNFIWPAAICLLVLLATVYFVAPVVLSRIAAQLARVVPSNSAQLSAARTVKRFGLDKLLPLFAVFCLLFFMDFAKTMVVNVGETLPGKISYRYDLWFLQHSSNDRFPCLWAHFSDRPKFSELQWDIERSLSEITASQPHSPTVENVENWKQQIGRSEAAFSACKFFTAWTILWAILEILWTRSVLMPFLRSAVCFLIISIAGALFLSGV